MRIGEFAKKNEVSIDTLRHYMDLELIVPHKKGSYYYFGEGVQKSFDKINELKGMGFTLKEIRNIFLYSTLGNLRHEEKRNFYNSVYKEKLLNIEKEIESLNNSRESILHKLDEIRNKDFGDEKTYGLDISNLELFSCSDCGASFKIESANIENNLITNGRLSCGCGKNLIIEDGILIYGDNEKAFVDLDFENVGEYIEKTDDEFLGNLYKNIKWIRENVDFSELNNGLIVELGTGFGFSIRNLLDKIPENSTYIAVDHNINKLKYIKSVLEKSCVERNIIFLCCDFKEIPLKKKSVDCILDFVGSTSYGFESSDFLMNIVDKYSKDQAILIGSYFLFANFMPDGNIAKESRHIFTFDWISPEIEKLGYIKKSDYKSGYISNSCEFESFFVKGEKIYSYLYYGGKGKIVKDRR